MLIALILIALIATITLPQWWAKRVLLRHSCARHDIPGTGAEFAQHLINHLGLVDYQISLTDQGDHFNPDTLTIGLSNEVYHGKSLTAMTVAAHEVGHAVQCYIHYSPLFVRSKWVRWAQRAERFGPMLMLAVPVIGITTRAPLAGLLSALIGLLILGLPSLVHLITLPVEWDASFRRALPILDAGQYLLSEDRRAAEQILTACALTYCAASLYSLLNFWRWMHILRR